MGDPPIQITCVECGGIAHLTSCLPDSEPAERGALLIYRCQDCWDRFDVIWEEDDD